MSFRFFSFDGSTKPPTICQGVFGLLEHQSLSLADLTSTPATNFILTLRPICEVIFSFLFLGYTTGSQASFERSSVIGLPEKRTRESTPAWLLSCDLGKEASRLAIQAASQAADGNTVTANATADAALVKLRERSFFFSWWEMPS
jgi:hypothetical protein